MSLSSNSAVIYDQDGNPAVGATGAAIPAAAVFFGGSDGTDLQAIKLDTAGRPEMVGPGTPGAAPVGNPVYVAGSDGTNLRAIALDTSGRPTVVGPGAPGAAPVGNPVYMGGSDGTNLRALRTDTLGRLQVGTSPTAAGTATLSNVSISGTNATLLASNANRLGATIFNDHNQVLYVKFGATASATSFTVAMSARSYYEIPFAYTGQIDGVTASGTGVARVTELTA